MASSSSYPVSLSSGINFYPATVAEEVVQNVRTILATRVGEVPLDRAFGTAWDMIDQALPAAMQLARADVFDAVQRFEPRAVVESIRWEQAEDAQDGVLHPVLTIGLADGIDGDASTAWEESEIPDAEEGLVTESGTILDMAAVTRMVHEAVATALASQNASSNASVNSEALQAAIAVLQRRVGKIYDSTTNTLDDVPESASQGGMVVLRDDG